MQQLNTSSESTGLKVAGNVTTGNVELAAAATTGDIDIGNEDMTGTIRIKGIEFPSAGVGITVSSFGIDVVKIGNDAGEVIADQASLIRYFEVGPCILFTSWINYDSTDDLVTDSSPLRIIDLPWTSLGSTTYRLYWDDDYPYTNAVKNHIITARSVDAQGYLELYESDVQNTLRLLSGSLKNAPNTVRLSGLFFKDTPPGGGGGGGGIGF